MTAESRRKIDQAEGKRRCECAHADHKGMPCTLGEAMLGKKYCPTCMVKVHYDGVTINL